MTNNKPLRQIIQERRSKTYSRQKYIEKQFEMSNIGKLKMKGIKKLAAQIENNNVRFAGFPNWVLDTYMDASKQAAIPLKNNKWLDVQTIINSSGDIDLAEITYGGFVVDGERNKESGVKTLNIVRSEDVDVKKYAKLLLFKRASNEAKKIIETKNKREMTMNAGMSSMPQEGALGQMTSATGQEPASNDNNSIEPTDATPEDDMAGTGGSSTTNNTDSSRIDPETNLEVPPKH